MEDIGVRSSESPVLRMPNRQLWLASLMLSSACPAIVLAIALLSCAPPTDATAADLSGSNLLLITVDTLRADRLGAYGDDLAATPNLDRLARNGVRFDNCYSPVPLTLPSHAALFTGKNPFAINVRTNGGYFLADSEMTLAEHLEQQGYATSAFVSTYILASRFGLMQGFDHYDDLLESSNLIRSFTSELPGDRVVNRFIAWLEAERPQQFFAWLHFYDPHLPYLPPGTFAERFVGDPYRGEIAFVDQQIGRALTALEATSSSADTLVVVTSDHGEAFGEHGETGHGLLAYDESLRVPLILSAPGRIAAGNVVDNRVRLTDLLPTLLDLLTEVEPSDIAGRSLRPLLAGATDEEPREVYFESLLGAEDYNWAPLTGLISGRYKYISLPQPELYDLSEDPDERRNLFRQQPGVVEQLDGRLRELLLATSSTTDLTRREVSQEDIAHLTALGYVGAAERSSEIIDPKQGVRIEQRIKDVRGLLDRDELEAAEASATELQTEYGHLEMAGLFALRHEIAARRGDKASALAILEDGIDKLPDSERLHFLLAYFLLSSGRLEESEAVSRKLLEMNPRFSQAFIVLGQAAEARRDLPAAIGHYEAALRLEPQSPPLRRRHADALLSAGRWLEALAEFEGLVSDGLLKNDADSLFKVAVLSSQAGRAEQAEDLFRRGLAVAPGGMNHITFGLLLTRNGKQKEAASHFEHALSDFADELTPEQRALAEGALAQLRTGAQD